MTREQKQEYTLRISQANSTQLIIILYEITLTYLKDANDRYEQGYKEEFGKQILSARKCIDEMMNNLNYEYEIARNLKQIYLAMKKDIRTAYLEESPERIIPVYKNLESLLSAYKKIGSQDTSAPIMEHTQTVIAGLTYGKNSISEDLSGENSSRGFCV